jgi:hypothetical protein
MPAKSHPWVVIGESPTRLGKCLRCGAVLNIEPPQPLGVWCEAAMAFVKIHARCKEVKS